MGSVAGSDPDERGVTAVAGPAIERATYSVPEAAAILGCSRSHYYLLFSRGEVPGLRCGNRIVVPRLQLDRYLNGEPWA